jgi:acetyltransferase-like isoleucine patch superfamily enzyme
MLNDFYLWGSGAGACEIRHIIDDLNSAGAKHVIRGLVGRGAKRDWAAFRDLNYIDTEEAGWKSKIASGTVAIITAGTPKLRKVMWDEIELLGLNRTVLIHPSAVIANNVHLAPGCVIGPNVTISTSVKLGENVYVSFNASIGHHSFVGAHGVISPGARLGGEVTCGPNFFVGINGVVVPRVKIGSDVNVSAGALVTGPLPDGSNVIQGRSRVLGGLG